MKIGFDFDGVISNLRLTTIPAVVGETFAVTQKKVAEKVIANQEALDLIHDLERRGHTVLIITGRHKIVAPETKAWMKKHGIGHIPVFFNPKENFTPNWLKSYKVKAVKAKDLGVYIEDQPVLAEAIARHTGTEVVLHRGDWEETTKDVMDAIRDVKKGKDNRPNIIGFDIDGVLTVTPPDHRERIKREGEKYREYIQRGGPPNTAMLKFVRELVHMGYKVYFITGRVGDAALARTREWFNDHGLADLKEHIHINREGTDPTDITLDKRHKEKAIKKLGVEEYYEDNAEIAEHLAKTTTAKIVLYKVGKANPQTPMRIILSVPHATGLPKEGRVVGHDFIAREMAERLAQRLNVPQSHLIIGDLPRELMDLNRERNRWKTAFRAKVRDTIKQAPSNVFHIDVHSFRVNSKVYGGNDIAIATTEKAPRPYEIELRDFIISNDLKAKIYTEMLMDVVPEARELGAPFSVLLEFNEGATPEMKDHYADIVAQFVRQKTGQANPFHEPPERSGRVCAGCGQPIGPDDDWVIPTTTSTWGGQEYYHKQCYKRNPAAQDRLIQRFGEGATRGTEHALRIDGDGLFSYSEQIAKRVIGASGLPTFYVKRRSFYGSQTSNRHCRAAWAHLSSNYAVEEVPPDSDFSEVGTAPAPARRRAGALPQPTQAQLAHENQRIGEMTVRQLHTRLGRMTRPDKVFAFVVALQRVIERSAGRAGFDVDGMNSIFRAAVDKLAALGYDTLGDPVSGAPREEEEETPRERHGPWIDAWNALTDEQKLEIVGDEDWVLDWEPLPADRKQFLIDRWRSGHWGPEGIVHTVDVAEAWGDLAPTKSFNLLTLIGLADDVARPFSTSVWDALGETVRSVLTATHGTVWNDMGIIQRPIPSEAEVEGDWNEIVRLGHGRTVFQTTGLEGTLADQPGADRFRYNTLGRLARHTLKATHGLLWQKPSVPVALKTYAELEVGDLVEADAGRNDRFVVVTHIGVLTTQEGESGSEISVWGGWANSPREAKEKYARLYDDDRLGVGGVSGVMRTDTTAPIYRVIEKGIFRSTAERYEFVKRQVEKVGTPVDVFGDEFIAWLYVPVRADDYPGGGVISKNATFNGRKMVMASTHPEIGLTEGDGTVVPIYADLRHFEIIRYLPHRVDLMYKDSTQSNFVSVHFGTSEHTEVGEEFNVRSVGVVANPHCILCSNLKTPKVYYQDDFIIICKDVKDRGKKSMLGMLKRHTKKPKPWERAWLMRMLHFIAGDVFKHEFSVEKTMRTEPSHWHVHAVGNPSR